MKKKKVTLKKVYFVYTEDWGEGDGVFDEKGNMLDFWFGNDANWRNEYFSPFMKKLGFECIELYKGPLYEKCLKSLHTAMKKASGEE